VTVIRHSEDRPRGDRADRRWEDEGWFRTLADTTATGIVVYDRERILYANRAAVELVGSSEEELLGTAPLDLVHPDFRAEVASRVDARMRGDRAPNRREIKLLTAGGERWVEVTAASITFGGRVAGLATVVDMTDRKRAEDELRASRRRHDLAQRAARYVTWEWDIASDELVVSGDAAPIFGVPASVVGATGREFLAAVHPDDRERFWAATRAAVKGEGDLAIEIRVVVPDGGVRWLDERGLVLRDDAGWGVRMIGVATDVTDRKRAEMALREEEERAQVTLASIGDGVIRTDAHGRIDYMNPVAEKLTGWSLAGARRRPLTEIYQAVDGATRKPLLNPVAACLRGEPWVDLPGYPLLLRRDGAEFPIQDSAAPIRRRDGAVAGAVLVFKDMTELHGMEREMSYLATHDPLTGLINRSELEARLASRLAGAREGAACDALCHVDLDEFKVVNDTCGHLAGDELLKQVAGLLRSALRPDDVLARLGGDEFGVLVAAAGHRGAREVAEQLLAALRRFRFHWRERTFEVRASVGLVPLTAIGGERTQLLAAAEAACYVAKEGGRNRIHEYQPDDRALAERRGEMQWIHRIHKAFEEGRFCLYRQPIQPLATAAAGPPLAEIFIRMRNGDGSLTTPAAFIPAAERYHLISSIDRWVVRSAFGALARRARLPGGDDATCFTINLSGQSLGDESFLDYVVAELGESGVAPARISFEITETAAIAHLARAIRFISVLKEMGCRFVLDDFGSGLSSFAYLKNLQVDFLKIAGEFVRDMAGDEVRRALVAAIHQVGHVMKIATIAEAVEDERTLEALRAIGVDYAQGYLLGRPEPL
jgi:diguanylate cyclase (GGDEF)-like protein/PAS domain S-box-containing protein